METTGRRNETHDAEEPTRALDGFVGTREKTGLHVEFFATRGHRPWMLIVADLERGQCMRITSALLRLLEDFGVVARKGKEE